MSAGRLRLVVATGNADKIREIREILANLDLDLLTADDVGGWPEPVEDGSTLEENARIKARAVHEATGIPAVADDTGLEVDALGGAPGVHSSRYSGEGATYESNCTKLLSEMAEVGAETRAERQARFRTVVATAGLGQDDICVDGVLEGRIATEASGRDGFGYDPVFVPQGESCTLAEMTLGEKNAISHRGRAFRAFAEALGELSARGGTRTPTPEGTGS